MSSAELPTVVLGLGGNFGDTPLFFERSIALLGNVFHLSARSSLYRTTPYGDPDQANFTNAVVAGTSPLSPIEFLHRLQNVEKALGKRPIRANGPRCIDLDLLFWGDQTPNAPGLIVPHPRAHLRDFVLLPLLEILPGFTHPAIRQSAKDLLDAIPQSERYVTGEIYPWIGP